MSDRMPLTEVGGDEALARITYQLIILDYKSHPDAYELPVIRLLALADQYHQFGLTQLAADLRLAAIWCGNGGTVASWLRARIVIRAGRATKLRRLGRSRER